MSLGVLSVPSVPFNVLLDAIRYAETGHLSPEASLTARSDANAVGPYQFLEKNLHDMGYGMPTDIPLSSVQDPFTSRDLAGQYVQGFTDHHNFKSPLEQLVAYTMGPTATAEWVARGSNLDELGPRTQNYILRAANYINDNKPAEDTQMADTTFMGLGFASQQAQQLADMAANGNPMAEYMMQFVQQPAQRIYTPEEQAAAAADFDQRMKNQNDNFFANLSPIQSATAQSANTVPTNAPPPNVSNTGGTQVGGATYNAQGQLRIPINAGAPQVSPTTGPTNRRDLSALSMVPPQARTNNRAFNDMLIRVGGAGIRGSAQGGLEGLGAMAETYGDIRDTEATNALAAYKAQMEAMGKRKGGDGSTAGSAVVNDDIARSLTLIREDQEGFFNNIFSGDLPATGVFSLLSSIPGTDSKALANRLRTIQANISFDKLQAMREASPTGGALGQVSTFELQNLMAVFGSLEQSQSADDLEYNLLRLQQVYNDIIHGQGNHPYGSFVGGQQSAAAAQVSSNVAAARSIVGNP